MAACRNGEQRGEIAYGRFAHGIAVEANNAQLAIVTHRVVGDSRGCALAHAYGHDYAHAGTAQSEVLAVRDGVHAGELHAVRMGELSERFANQILVPHRTLLFGQVALDRVDLGGTGNGTHNDSSEGECIS